MDFERTMLRERLMQEVRVEEQVELALERETFILFYGKYTALVAQ